MINGVIEIQPDQFINWNKVQTVSFVKREDDDNKRHVMVEFENKDLLTFGRITPEWEENVRKQMKGGRKEGVGFG